MSRKTAEALKIAEGLEGYIDERNDWGDELEEQWTIQELQASVSRSLQIPLSPSDDVSSEGTNGDVTSMRVK